MSRVCTLLGDAHVTPTRYVAVRISASKHLEAVRDESRSGAARQARSVMQVKGVICQQDDARRTVALCLLVSCAGGA